MARNLLKIAALTGAALALSVSLPLAGGHSPVEKRQAAMKTVGASTKVVGDMMKGTTSFDAAKANAALAAMQEAVVSYGDFFPEGSEAANSEAGPNIWSDRAGFDAVLADFKADLAAAVSAAPQDKEGVGAAFGAVTENCRACHEDYRVKKN